MKIEEGQSFEIRYPFVKEWVTLQDEEGSHNVRTWRPGVQIETCPYSGEVRGLAHGEGAMLLEVVSIHKPGRYPTRVFYTRKWRNPNGQEFGKPGLRVTTLDAFRRRAVGYGYPYELDPSEA